MQKPPLVKTKNGEWYERDISRITWQEVAMYACLILGSVFWMTVIAWLLA